MVESGQVSFFFSGGAALPTTRHLEPQIHSHTMASHLMATPGTPEAAPGANAQALAELALAVGGGGLPAPSAAIPRGLPAVPLASAPGAPAPGQADHPELGVLEKRERR